MVAVGMAEDELQGSPWYWRWVELVWSYTGTVAIVAVLGGTLGRGVIQLFQLHESPARLVCCAGLSNPAGAEPPKPLGVLGVGIKPPVPHARVLKNAQGQVISAEFVDAKGRLTHLPASKVARQTVEYNADGRVIKRVNRDENGKLAEDAAGVAVREFDYDAAGRLVKTSYRGGDGRLTAARPLGVAAQQVTYDAQGRPLMVRNLSRNGTPVLNAAGEETLRYEYNDASGEVLRRNYVQETPADNHAGYAVQRIVCGEDGRELRREWRNASGFPVAESAAGAVAVVQQHYPDSRIVRQIRLGTDGAPLSMSDGWSEHLVRYDVKGRPEWECYAGADGLPRDNAASGYAERVSTYAPGGQVEREYFWRADGSPAPVCERRYAAGADGQPYCLSLHADGSSEVSPVSAPVSYNQS